MGDTLQLRDIFGQAIAHVDHGSQDADDLEFRIEVFFYSRLRFK